MYKTILVPLDGSELAELVLPHVEMLAKGGVEPAEVILLRVCEVARMVMGGYGEAVGQMAVLTEQAAAAFKADAEEYLAARKALKCGQFYWRAIPLMRSLNMLPITMLTL